MKSANGPLTLHSNRRMICRICLSSTLFWPVLAAPAQDWSGHATTTPKDFPAELVARYPRLANPEAPLGVEGCLICHGEIEDVMLHMNFEIECTLCHGGDPDAMEKELAHVQPELPPIMDQTVPPLDYDLPYQRFVNPSNLRVVGETCGLCHGIELDRLPKSMMAHTAGHHAGGLYQNGVVDTKTPIYGNFAITDDDGVVPYEKGAVDSLEDLIRYDPEGDPQRVSTHYAAVPGQACVRCHLWSRGKGYRGAVDRNGLYRADGCAACHMPYANDGLSQSADQSINHEEPGHPRVHIVTRAIPTEQCLHCHHRGARIGLSYTGRAQMPPNLPSGPGVPGTTDERFNGNYHYVDPATNPADLHHEAGLHCIDCHTKRGIMGDGNIYGHMDQATKIECESCHGLPTAYSDLRDIDGAPLSNAWVDNDGNYIIRSKVTGADHRFKQAKDVVNRMSSDFNPRAACAMNENHLKPEGGLECHACHTSWTPNCFGCHFQRDERLMGLNLITREEEVGKASTNNKVFEALRHFSMGPNRRGKIAPYIVGCQPIADVTAPDGSKILDFKMPETVNGLSGLALDPVNPHTVRAVNEVRACAECHRAPPALGLGTGNYSLSRDYALMTVGGGVAIYDRRTDPENPTLLGTLPVASAHEVATLPDIIEGTARYVYVAGGEAGLLVFNLTDEIPDQPVTVVEGVNAIDVARAARYLYVVDSGVGIRIYDNHDPEVAELLATIPVPTARRVVPWGIHLFVAAGNEGFVVVNIADHQAPFVAGGLAGIQAVDVRLYAHFQMGNAFAARAYVADPQYGVRIVDLLPDFDSPSLTGGIELPGVLALDTYSRYLPADHVTPSREHDYLYVAAGVRGLHVFDITKPDEIEEVAAVTDLGGMAMDVDVSSEMTPPGVHDYAVIANDPVGLQVVEVTDPRAPVRQGTVAVAGASRVMVEVQQLDRFIDEQGSPLKENSHPGVGLLTREDFVRILSTDIAVDCRRPGDHDGDDDVDLDDFTSWPDCMTGPAAGPYPEGCDPFDFDVDEDVDLYDFAMFELVLTP